ncbi:Uncharacterised protein [uncultured archaeon]|nr:Uncharacterised protein [uncultured archaeon]
MSHTYKLLEKLKEDAKPREEAKQPEKPKPKNEYIVADNYVPKDKRKQQVVIEAEEKVIVAEDKGAAGERFKRPSLKKSERVKEGVEIFETPKKR